MTISIKPYLSIIVPLYNEEEVFLYTYKELVRVCREIGKDYEIIFVDDGSKDKTFELIKREALNNPAVKVLRFSRNFGHQAAFSAGLDYSSGDLVITMDGDLQHPPNLIKKFIEYAEEGFDIVIGERLSNKQNSKAREFVGKLFYKFLSAVTNLEFKNVSDFALYTKQVVVTLKQLPEKERYLRGLVQWVGFKKKYVPYIVEERKAGSPKYTTKKLSGLIMSGVTSFSAFPLRIAFWIGSLVLIFAFTFSGYVVWDHYVNPNPLNIGNSTTIILILLLGSLQMMILGVIGEYLYKMFNEIKGRPVYIVSKTENIEQDETTDINNIIQS